MWKGYLTFLSFSLAAASISTSVNAGDISHSEEVQRDAFRRRLTASLVSMNLPDSDIDFVTQPLIPRSKRETRLDFGCRSVRKNEKQLSVQHLTWLQQRVSKLASRLVSATRIPKRPNKQAQDLPFSIGGQIEDENPTAAAVTRLLLLAQNPHLSGLPRVRQHMADDLPTWRWFRPFRLASTGEAAIDKLILTQLNIFASKYPNLPIDKDSFPAQPGTVNAFFRSSFYKCSAGANCSKSRLSELTGSSRALDGSTSYWLLPMLMLGQIKGRGWISSQRAFPIATTQNSKKAGAWIDVDAMGGINHATCDLTGASPSEGSSPETATVAIKLCLAAMFGASASKVITLNPTDIIEEGICGEQRGQLSEGNQSASLINIYNRDK